MAGHCWQWYPLSLLFWAAIYGLPVFNCLDTGWPEKLLEVMIGVQGQAQCRTNGPTDTVTPQYSGDKLDSVVVLGWRLFDVLFIPGCLKIVCPRVIHCETHHSI